MTGVEDLKVKIFADGADLAAMQEMYARPYVKGFTTNPTLMRKAGIRDYAGFARDVLRAIPDRPISFVGEHTTRRACCPSVSHTLLTQPNTAQHSQMW